MTNKKQLPFPAGLKIVNVVWLTDEQLKKEGWQDRGGYCPALLLEDGSLVYASCDPEGNGPGMLFGTTYQEESVYIYPIPEAK